MSNNKARVGTGRYAPRALGIISGVMLLAAVPTVSCYCGSCCLIIYGRVTCQHN
jgi:hypothetical protein